MLKITLDTNIFLSAFIFGGISKTIFDLILDNKLQLYTSSDLQKEVLKKFKQFGAGNEALTDAKLFLEEKSIYITPKLQITICRDPKDNYILELAQTAQADFLITRDKDLLDLPDNASKNTKIVKPEEFLPFLRSIKLLP